MRLIPVLDLKRGVVVRGVGGRRDEYRPIESKIARSAEAVEVASALRERFGFHEFYIADLDAIAGGPPHSAVLHELVQSDLQLLVDAGLRDVAAGQALLAAGAVRVIAALETSPGPEHLKLLLAALGPDRVTFSVDMKAGALLTAGEGWKTSSDDTTGATGSASTSARGATGSASASTDGTTIAPRPSPGEGRATRPVDLAVRVLACGVRSLIVLDLAGVGEGRGVPTLELCRGVRAKSPEVEIITGGGVRNAGDLEALEAAGVDGVLIASALHDGSLTPDDCARWRR